MAWTVARNVFAEQTSCNSPSPFAVSVKTYTTSRFFVPAFTVNWICFDGVPGMSAPSYWANKKSTEPATSLTSSVTTSPAFALNGHFGSSGVGLSRQTPAGASFFGIDSPFQIEGERSPRQVAFDR